jgi:hypothetical protein
MAHNIKWEGYFTHIAIYDVKITLQLVGGWWTFCADFQVTIGGSSS